MLKQYDEELPILKNITDTSDIYAVLEQFGFSKEEIESFMLVKKYGIANPNNIKMQLKFTEYKQIISEIQDKIKNAVLTNGLLQISDQDKLLLNSKPPETISYSEYKVQPLNIQNLYAYEPDSNSDNCNLKFVLSILSKYSMYLKRDNSWPDIQSYSVAIIEIKNNKTDVTIMPTFYFTDEGIRLYFQTIASMKNTDTVLQTNKIPADIIHLTKPQNLTSDLIEAFTELKQYQADDRYKYLENNIIDIIEETTNLEELTAELNDFIENEYYIVFYGVCDRLTEGYYTS